MKTKLLIKGGRVFDPETGFEEICDVLVEGDKIEKIEKDIKEKADRTIDAAGCYVMPGFIDLHVHLRDPGLTHKETVETGAKAAARGGFTTICAMPNTKPVIDDPTRVDYVHNKAKRMADVNVLQIGAVTKGMIGDELSDIEGMIKSGIPAISEDGKSVMNAGLYREAMKIAAKHDIPVFAHCEDITMVRGGVLNAGKKAKELGVAGITNSVEDVIVARDILLSKETGARLHLCHCSTKDSMVMLRDARKKGIPVTAEVCPHHFTLSEEDIKEADSNYKMNPPLRSKEDKEALIEGLKNGLVDVIATDHAPHHKDEKAKSVQDAPFGIVGLETAAGLTVTELVAKGILTPMQMAEKLSYNPARILGSDKGRLQEGRIADIVVLDPEKSYTVDAKKFASKGKNTPFDGRKLKGAVIATICGGKIVYHE